MQATNIRFHRGTTWDEYQKLPGRSFSWLKTEGEPIKESEGMRVGKLVHLYLNQPELYNGDSADMVRPIARAVKDFTGDHLMRVTETEIGITADFEHEGLIMPWRGMPDRFISGKIVIDFKILAGRLRDLIGRFLYEEQIRGYMKPVKAPAGLIIGYNKNKKQIETHMTGECDNWWNYKIKQYGIPAMTYRPWPLK